MDFRVLERGCADDFVIDVQQRFEPLLGPDGLDTVSFSPTLIAVERKHVHEAAKLAGLKSRSTGQGSERFIEVFRAGSQPALVAKAEPAEGADEGVSRGCAEDFVIDVQQRFEPLLEPDGPDTVSFSPTLLAVERKHVHEAAKLAGLKSRSSGQGSERFIEVFRAGSQPALVAAAEPAEGPSEGVSRDERISRMVSSILRHRAERVGVRLRPDGFARVDDILKLNNFRKIRCTSDDILNMAKSCPKQRFAIRLEGGHHWVRANQGHTIAKVEDTELLRPIASPDDLRICVHGTYWMHWESIRQNGLRAMGRNHIHFIPRIPGEQVTSGMRVDVQLAIYIDAPRAMADGCAFMWSANQVVLSRGFVGVVPPSYFVKVVALSCKFGYAKGDEVQLDGPLPRPSVAADVVSDELRLSDQEQALCSDGDDSSEEEVLLAAPMLAEAYGS